jgi:hypothetical protein
MKHCFSKMIILGIIAAWQLSAGTLVQDLTPAGTLTLGYFGEELVTPVGGPWNSLTFNFFSADSLASGIPSTPAAAGTLYLLNSEYLGLASALSTSTPGYLASTSTVSGGVWDFASSVTVSPGVTYWLYGGSQMSALTVTNSSAVNPPTPYFDVPEGPVGFFPVTGADVNFNFSGTVVTTSGTPEPTTLLLMAPALLLVLRRRLTR